MQTCLFHQTGAIACSVVVRVAVAKVYLRLLTCIFRVAAPKVYRYNIINIGECVVEYKFVAAVV